MACVILDHTNSLKYASVVKLVRHKGLKIPRIYPCRFNLNKCYQCGNTIDKVEELSIEHKTPWLDSDTPKELFFNLENIAFSHLSCNCRARRSNTGLMKKSTINRVYDGNHNGRLSSSKVEEIRELLRVNSRRKVAEITGASKTTIARIARGEIYKYI